MAVLSRLIQAPAAVRIGPGVAAELPAILADQRISASGRLAVAISEGSGTQLREQLAGKLPEDVGWFTVSRASLDAAVDLADRVRADKAPYDTLVAIGGGKVIDAAKYAAARLGMPLVAVATNLAHDGVCSPVATLENDAGTGSYGVPNPIGVVIDLDIIRQAPPRFVRAGHRRGAVEPLRAGRLGARAPGDRRAGGRPGRGDGAHRRRSRAAPAGHDRGRPTSSACWPTRWCSPARRWPSPGPAARSPAPATRSTTR